MTDKTPSPGNAPGLSDDVRPIRNVIDAIDELHSANDLMELVFMAANSQQESSIVRGAVIAQEFLRNALVCLEDARVALGGEPKGSRVQA